MGLRVYVSNFIAKFYFLVREICAANVNLSKTHALVLALLGGELSKGNLKAE